MSQQSAAPWPDLATLTATWAAKLGHTPPLGSNLRAYHPDRWVRFYYLPDGERIARTRAQRAEVLSRFQAVLAELGDNNNDRLVVTTVGWGPSTPAPRPPDLAALLPGAYWREVPADSADDLASSVYATSVAAAHSDPTMAEFLMVWVADELTAEAVIAPPSLEWLMHPYDGGMDVIARDESQRNALAQTFADWRSPRPDGL